MKVVKCLFLSLIVLASCDDDSKCVESNLTSHKGYSFSSTNRSVFYTDAGKLSLLVDTLQNKNLETTTYSYDGFGRLSRVDYKSFTGSKRTSKIYYSETNSILSNRRTGYTNPLFDDSVVFVYNTDGRLSSTKVLNVANKSIMTQYDYSYPTADSVNVQVRDGGSLNVSSVIKMLIDDRPTPYPIEAYYSDVQATPVIVEHNLRAIHRHNIGGGSDMEATYTLKYNGDGYLTDDGKQSLYSYACDKPQRN